MRLKRVIALAAGVVVTLFALAAMQWQLGRADEKLARQAAWDAALAAAPRVIDPAALAQAVPALPAHVRLRGRFVPEATVYLDNRMLGSVAGMRVITPIEPAPGAPWVLVDRGFAPRDPADRGRLPAAPPPAGEVEIEGLALPAASRVLELGSAPPAALPGLWQNLDYDAYESAARTRVARLVVVQSSAAADGLRRDFSPPASGVEKHRGYAFQWGALAALAAGLTLYFGLRRKDATQP